MKKVNLDMEFEKFKRAYKGNSLEKDWQTYQQENDLYDLSFGGVRMKGLENVKLVFKDLFTNEVREELQPLADKIMEGIKNEKIKTNL